MAVPTTGRVSLTRRQIAAAFDAICHAIYENREIKDVEGFSRAEIDALRRLAAYNPIRGFYSTVGFSLNRPAPVNNVHLGDPSPWNEYAVRVLEDNRDW